ncbi:MAG TPA: AI-2E family transporter [Gammaproteobacteria bacterium]|nr:AI-2E family transporter [Gammaproteobacteria bacterium]
MSDSEHSEWWPHRFAQRCAIAAGIALLAVALAVFLWSVSQGLLVMFSAMLFAVMLNGLAKTVSRHTRIRRQWVLAVTVSVVAAIVIGVFVLGAVRIGQQAPQLHQGLIQSMHQIRGKLQQLGLQSGSLGLGGLGAGPLKSGAAFFERNLSTSIELVTDAFIIVIAGIYFAVNPDVYIRTLLMVVPPRKQQRVRELIDELGVGLWRWLLGRFASMLAVGLMTMVGLSALGVHLAFVLGLIAGALTFIPYLGTIISLVPAVLMGLLQSPMTALYVLLLFIGAHLLEGYILSPLIQERAVHLAPGWLLTAQLLGSLAAGLFGIIIAAPVMVVVTIVVQMLYIEDVLGEKIRLLGE